MTFFLLIYYLFLMKVGLFYTSCVNSDSGMEKKNQKIYIRRTIGRVKLGYVYASLYGQGKSRIHPERIS